MCCVFVFGLAVDVKDYKITSFTGNNSECLAMSGVCYKGITDGY